MDTLQATLKQHLVEQTQQLVAHGGPAAVRSPGRLRLHYEPIEAWRYESPRAGETYYPVAAVLAALSYPDLRTLQDDWSEALSQPGPLPLYLHPTAQGHYTAMVAESLVLEHLILLTQACHDAMLAD